MRQIERQISTQKGLRTKAKTNEQVAKAVQRIQQLQQRLESVNSIGNRYMENIYKGFGNKKFDLNAAGKKYSRSRYMYGRVTG